MKIETEILSMCVSSLLFYNRYNVLKSKQDSSRTKVGGGEENLGQPWETEQIISPFPSSISYWKPELLS